MSLDNWTYAPATPANQLGDRDYLEFKESGHEAYSPGASTANRCFLVSWDNRADFLGDLLGYSYYDSGPGYTIKRVLPAEHPEITNFFAEDATVDGIGVLSRQGLDILKWDVAKVNSNYKFKTYDVKTDADVAYANGEMDRYTTKMFDVQGDYLTMQGGVRFVTAANGTHPGNALQATPGRVIGYLNLAYTWHQVPAKFDKPFIPPNINNIIACEGKVNSATFDVNGINAPAGTVLFLGAETKIVSPLVSSNQSVNPIGIIYWDITFKFIYRNNGLVNRNGINETAGHQFYYDIANNRWDLVTNDGQLTGARTYEQADLNSLWTVT